MKARCGDELEAARLGAAGVMGGVRKAPLPPGKCWADDVGRVEEERTAAGRGLELRPPE